MDQAIPDCKETKGEGRVGRFSMVTAVEWSTTGECTWASSFCVLYL
jgi:hypothetical protein